MNNFQNSLIFHLNKSFYPEKKLKNQLFEKLFKKKLLHKFQKTNDILKEKKAS
jgi:hypothetical protein